MIEVKNVINTIIQGNTLDILKQFPDESINMVITSPPYWGLRNYETNPQIWDGEINCKHEWSKFIKKGISGGNKSEIVHKKSRENFQAIKDEEQSFCNKCGAWKGELGSEPTFDLYINHLMQIFNEVKRVLTKDGTCWVNINDTYSGSGKGAWNKKDKQKERYVPDKRPNINEMVQPKSLCCVPDRFKIAMVDNEWICRNEIIWYKPNAMPSSVKDRFTVDFEKLFFFVKNRKYYFEQQLEPYISKPQKPINKNEQNCNNGYNSDRFSPGKRDYYSKGKRNKRCVWSINTRPFKEAHFAVYPEKLIEIPIKAGCPKNGIVLDIFMGSGTTGLVAKRLNRNYIGIELNPKYIEIANKRIDNNKN